MPDRRQPGAAPARWAVICFLLILVTSNASCRDAPHMEGCLRIGLPEEPRTMNVFLASDGNTRNVLRQIYQPLYEHHPETLEIVPWLAATLPTYDREKKSYTLTLRTARWSDGRELTSNDVAFTARLIQEFKPPGLSERWQQVARIETPDPATVIFYLKKPIATFLTRTLQVPIVPAHQWGPIVESARGTEKPLAALLNHEIAAPIGSGPFVLKKWTRGDFLHFEKNDHFFASGQTIGGRRLGPHVNGLLLKIYGTTDVAMLALRRGEIDMFWQGIQPGYIDILSRDPHIRVYTSPKSALYYMGMNLRRPPFDDAHLRRAVAVLIDKDFIVERLLQGRGAKMFSIVPPGNEKWCHTGLPPYADGQRREERIRTAYAMLSRAGYSWDRPPVDARGHVVPGEGFRSPDGNLVAPFTILTPPADYDPARAISGTIIQEWLREVGMPASARPMEFSALIDQIKNRHDFDAFILGYGRLSLDPSYLGAFFDAKNDKARGWNMSGYHNETFDQLAARAEKEMDPVVRREIILEMQRIIIEDVPYLPLYVPDLIEAVRTDRFDGWVSMLDGIGNRWSFNEIRPVE